MTAEVETTASPDVDPFVVASVEIPDGSVTGTYQAAFIPAGSYTAAFTCGEDMEADEDIDIRTAGRSASHGQQQSHLNRRFRSAKPGLTKLKL